jgi:membrane protease subunit (stomatin/prohibitin family)
MSLGDFIKKQFVDVIDWTESGDGVLAYRFPMRDAEIQYGGKLTVRESQMALFVNEGKVADAFGPGLYTLETQNIPLLTNLQNWDKAFKSPFKSDVYYFSTRLQTNQKWGTAQPVTVRDAEFGAVRIRAFGTYAFRIANPLVFHQKISGTRDIFTVADIEPQLRSLVIGRMSQAIAEAKVPFLDLAANLYDLGTRLRDALSPSFADLGLTLDTFIVESVSLPDELQKKLDERISMNMVGNLNDYTKFQVAQSIPLAAQNPGGIAGLGAGLGAGMGIGQAMADALKPSTPAAPAAPATPPAAPAEPAKPSE